MLLVNLRKLLLSDPNIQKSINSPRSHSTPSVYLTDRWVVRLRNSIFHSCLEGHNLTPTIHYFFHHVVLLVADIPVVMFSNSFLWEPMRFQKRAQISVWKHFTEAYQLLRNRSWNTNVAWIWGQEIFLPLETFYYSHMVRYSPVIHFKFNAHRRILVQISFIMKFSRKMILFIVLGG